MKLAFYWVALFCLAGSLRAAVDGADNPQTADAAEVRQPHTPTLIFYLTGAGNRNDATAIRDAVEKLKSATAVEVNTNHSYARIRFDSHIVSYHQVAQAIADAGTSLGKNYDPWLVFSVTNYDVSTNASGVDRIFAGKRLNTRVTVKPLDPVRGLFQVHFRPLIVDPHETAPQGFNGGHIHHPISDPPPRGLGLPSDYASVFDPSLFNRRK
jgi:copper chaperone CopZ